MADRQDGFSLIETLVALALLGLVSGTFYSSYTTSMAGTEAAAQTALATRLARSKLDEIAVTGLLEAGSHKGTTGDGFRWQIEVDPIEDSSASAADSGRRVTQQAALVTVTVSWQGRRADRSVKLSTVRLIDRRAEG